MMFYSQCNNCNERWELGTASTCTCVTNASATIPVDRFSHLGQRTWVGLTDEDFQPMVQKAMVYYGYKPEHSTLTSGAGFYALVRNIEAALKAKNT